MQHLVQGCSICVGRVIRLRPPLLLPSSLKGSPASEFARNCFPSDKLAPSSPPLDLERTELEAVISVLTHRALVQARLLVAGAPGGHVEVLHELPGGVGPAVAVVGPALGGREDKILGAVSVDRGGGIIGLSLAAAAEPTAAGQALPFHKV